MITCVIRPTEEPTVVQLTQENLTKELRQINGAELLVMGWGEGIAKARNNYICLVEADCLINSGYFASLLGLFKKNQFFYRLAVMGTSVGINNWADRIYGYKLGERYSDGVLPIKTKPSSGPTPIQIPFIPGALIKTGVLRKVKIEPSWENDLVYFSAMISLDLWRKGMHLQVNPNTTYVTTEEYVGEIGKFDPQAKDLAGKKTKGHDSVFIA